MEFLETRLTNRAAHPESLEFLEQALSSQVKPLDAALRSEVEALRARARQYVGQVQLALQPTAAHVLVDRSLRPLPPDGRLTLQVGEHTLEVIAERYQTERRSLDIRGGETQTLAIQLGRDLGLSSDAVPAREGEPLYASPWLWTGVGAAVVAAVVVLAIVLQPDARTRVGEPITTPQTPPGLMFEALRGP